MSLHLFGTLIYYTIILDLIGLYRRIWNKQHKNLPFQNWEIQAGSQFLAVLEKNSNLLRQPLLAILNIIMFEVSHYWQFCGHIGFVIF